MTQVNWNRQLALAAALFLLGGAAFWLEYKHKPAKEAEEQQAKSVFHLKDHQVQSMTLVNEGKELQFSCLDLSAKLCKSGSNAKWEIQKPMKLKADDGNVNALLSTLNNLKSENTIHLEEETPEKRGALLKEYGLDPQSRKTDRKIFIQTDAGSVTLYLGAPHPIGETTFALVENAPQGQPAKVDETTVYSIPNYLNSNFTRDLTSWRNKKLFTLAAHEVGSFQLKGSQGEISGERKAGQWVLQTGKEETPGDAEAINGLLSSATNLSAKGFASDQKSSPQAKALLKGWVPILSLAMEKEKVGETKESSLPVTLTLFGQENQKKGGASSKLYATVSNLDPLFELDSGAKSRLDKGLKDLRMTKLLTSLDRFTVKRIEFSGKPIGSTPIVLIQSDGKWVRQSDKMPVSDKKVQDTLDKLASTRIRSFLGASSFPPGASEGVTLTLGDDKNDKKRQILFWKKGEDLYAEDLQAKVKEGLALDPALKEVLPWSADHFNSVEPKPSSAPEAVKK